METAKSRRQIRVRVRIKTRSAEIATEVDVPARCRSPDLLEALRAVDDAVIADARYMAEQTGRFVSCREGCSACCRHFVPVSTAEAHSLAAVVRSFPDDLRARVLKRFALAKSKLTDSGLWGAVVKVGSTSRESGRTLASEYFRMGIACPFLENDRCVIYEQRPLACREYLVTSPAENCTEGRDVERLPVPGRIGPLLRKSMSNSSSQIALVSALDWVAANRLDDEQARPGPMVLANLLHASSETLTDANDGGETC